MTKKKPRNFIRYFRAANKLNQRGLGELMCVSQGTVCNWESGRTNPTKAHIKALMDLFDCTFEELFPHEDPRGFEIPERFRSKSEAPAEPEPAVEEAMGGAIALEGLWHMDTYRADGEGDVIALRCGKMSGPVPIGEMRDAGPWRLVLVPAQA